MNGNMVSWKDYEAVDGFGVSSGAEVDNLQKALTAGQAITAPGSVVAGDGFAMRVESLEKTLKNTTYKMDHLRFFKALPKRPAYNTVEEFNLLHSYGENPGAGFIAEGDLPEGDDSSYERKYAVVKYMGTVRRVSHVASLIKPAHQALVAQETINGTMLILKMLEQALFEADSSLSDLQFDGFEKLITSLSPSTNVVDLRGKPLSEDILTDVALTVYDAPNYGIPTHLFLNPKVKADLVKSFFPKERHDTFKADKNGMIGGDLRGWTSPAGDVAFEPDVFITDGGGPTAAVGDAAKRPATPVISTGLTSPADAAGKFVADDAGDYFVKVQAVNRYGRSAAVQCGAGANTIAAGDKITFGVTPGAGPAVEWYEVFRSLKNGAVGTCRRVLRVANAAGVGETVINEYNAKIPGTTNGYLLQMNTEALSFKQLAPMVKIPLATIDSSIRWMQLLYGVPVIYTPGKHLLIKNIGRSAGYVGAL